MSRLGDRLRKLDRGDTAAPLGFGAAAGRTRHPAMLILAMATDGLSQDRWLKAGADGLVLTAGKFDRQEAGESLRGLAWSGDEAAATQADFVVGAVDELPAQLLAADETSLVLRVSGDEPDSFLGTVRLLPVDAVVVSFATAHQVSLADIMRLQRVAMLTGKALFIEGRTGSSRELLAALRDSGVGGILVDAEQGWDEAAIQQLHETLLDLPPRKAGKGRETAVLPSGLLGRTAS